MWGLQIFCWFITIVALPMQQGQDSRSGDLAPETNQINTPIRQDHYGDSLPQGAIERLGTIRLTTPQGIHSVLFSNDGKHLVTSHDLVSKPEFEKANVETDGIRIWDAASGKLLRKIGGVAYGPSKLVASPDGKLLATSSGNGVICLIEFETGKIRYQMTGPDQGNVYALAFSPDGKTIALSGSGSRIQLWDVVTGDILKKFGPADGSGLLCYTPDGKYLASARKDDVHLWDLATGKEIWHVDLSGADFFDDMKITRNGKFLAISSRKDQVWLLETATGKPVVGWPAKNSIGSKIAFSPDDKVLAASSSAEGLRFLEIPTAKQIDQWPGQVSGSLAFSPNGKMLAIAEWDGFVHLLDLENHRDLFPVLAHTGMVATLAYSPDGESLATGGWEGAVKIWRPSSGTSQRTFKASDQPITTVAYSPDGKLLAAATWDGKVKLYGCESGAESLLTGNTGTIALLAFLPNSKHLATTNTDKTVQIWDVATSKPISRMVTAEDSSGFQGLAISSDGRMLARGRRHGIVEVFDVASGKLLNTLRGNRQEVNALAFRPNSESLAVAGADGFIRLIDVITGRELVRYVGWSGGVRSFAFSRDGWFLVAGTAKGKVILWEVLSGKKVGEWRGHEGEVLAVAFSPDGRTFCSSGRDREILVWDATTPLHQPDDVRTTARGDAQDLVALWRQCADKDAGSAYRAIWQMRSEPEAAARFLEAHLIPAPAIASEPIRRLIQQLDDAKFSVREEAERQLAEYQELAVPLIQEALAGAPSRELRRRCEGLLKKVKEKPLTKETLRELRALAVLESLNHLVARQAIAKLAAGAAGARLTREATNSLNRFDKRHPNPSAK